MLYIVIIAFYMLQIITYKSVFIDYTPFKVIIKQWLHFPMLYNISYK